MLFKAFSNSNAYKQSLENVASECVNTIKKKYPNISEKTKNLTKTEILYHVNKILLHHGASAKLEHPDFIPIVNEANSGNIIAGYAADFYDVVDFREVVQDENLAVIANFDIPKNQKFEACLQLLNDPPIADYDLLIYFYLECSDSFFDYKNNYVKFDKSSKT